MRDEQVENDRFVRAVGSVEKADRLQQIWKNSYPFMGKSKIEIFKESAKAGGYTDNQIRMLLELP